MSLSQLKRRRQYWTKYGIGKTECGFNRTGIARFAFCTCDITGDETLCVCMDSSEDEYGPIYVSLNYINKLAQERKLLNLTQDEFKEDQKLLQGALTYCWNSDSDGEDEVMDNNDN